MNANEMKKQQQNMEELKELKDVDALRLLIAGLITANMNQFDPLTEAKIAWDRTDALFSEFQNRKTKKS
jgi:hypothetical protein